MPWFLISSLKGISEIIHQCLSSWKQLSGECTFLAAVFPAHTDREALMPFHVGLQQCDVQARCMGEVMSFFPTKWILLELIN